MVSRTLVSFVVLILSLSVDAPGNAQDLSAEDQSVVFFERAREAFDIGEFERANLLLREAIELNDVAPLHYNLARALQELGEWEEARDEYETYLRMDPNTPERTRVEARIRIMNERIQGRSEEHAGEPLEADAVELGAAELDADGEVTEETATAGSNRMPWIVFGTGLAALAGGGVSGLLSRRSIDEARLAPSHEMAEHEVRAAERQSLAANVLFGVGGTLALGGLIWALMSRKGQPSPTNVTIGVGNVQLRHDF